VRARLTESVYRSWRVPLILRGWLHPGMTHLAEVRGVALALPGVVETTSFRLPTFTVAGKGFLTLEKGGTTAILAVGETEAAGLAAAEPDVFEVVRRNERTFVGVRARLPAVPADRLRGLVENAWRTKAPKNLQSSYTG
jgi:hypothetical protein